MAWLRREVYRHIVDCHVTVREHSLICKRPSVLNADCAHWIEFIDHGAVFIAKSVQGPIRGTITHGHHELFAFTSTVSIFSSYAFSYSRTGRQVQIVVI